MKLKHARYANNKLSSSFGLLEFDENGILKTELEKDALGALAEIPGFTKVEVEPVKEVKQPVEVDNKGKETQEEASPTKKSIATKTTKKTTK